MIVVDSSAVVALLLGEPEAPRVEAALASSLRCLLPAPCHVELSLVLSRVQEAPGLGLLDQMVARGSLEVHPFTEAHARAARAAFLRFGKGRHPAALNFGDCMSYAVARTEGLPLLFVGDDFARTDVAAA